MTVYRFRILLDHPENIFRDIDIKEDASFQDLHDTIVESYGYSGMEMASFFMSNDEWDKGEEIALMDMTEPGQDPVQAMSDTALNSMVKEKGDKILYLYDFLNMWIYYGELIEIYEVEKTDDLPKVVLSVGDAPSEKDESENDMSGFADMEDFDDLDDYDEGGEFESLDDYPDL